jgi:uncharacterized protein (DUF433 family)
MACKTIEINPKVLLGKPIIRGTGIPVELIVKLKAQGRKNGEILKEYPVLKQDDIRAALFYAERVLEEEEIFSFDGMSGVKPGKKSTLRLPGLKAWACSGLTLSGASLPRLKRRGLPSTRAQAEGAPPNGSNR